MANSHDIPCMRFMEKYCNNYEDCKVLFNITTSLREAVEKACCVDDFSERRVLMLYFHNESDEFSKQLLTHLMHDDVADFLNNHFYVLAWDITVESDHDMLKDEVKKMFDLDIMADLITRKKSAAFLITTVSAVLNVFSFMHGSITKDNLMLALQQVQKAMKEEYKVEEELQNLFQNEKETVNGIGSEKFQQIMYDRLGDRDYDCFEFEQHEYLKDKIGYALYGPPKDEKGYDEKEKKEITHIYNKICLVNNEHSKWNDRIVISFIYNCTEPLLSEKLKRAKEYKDYNPLTDLYPVPIFVLRKCKCSDQPCRVFIDHDARVYASWKELLEKNKLPKCKMILPKDGRYQGDQNVLLEEHFSPACDMSVAVLQGADIVSTVAGLASGGVFVAAMIPAITVAPIALTIAGVTGIGVGLYSIARSSFMLADRSARRESVSFRNSEARGAYINIVAGSLGFVGAGATAAVSTLSSRGVNIGMGARVLLNTINGANIAAGGVGIANSAYDVLYQIFVDKQRPSALTIVQLSSSILFFGNAVYNFKTAGTIIEERQVQTLNEIEDSLRSNRHRKTFNKLLKETMRQNGENRGKAEVIATLRNANRDEVLAVLTRSNKNFNKSGIRFSAQEGKIALNGKPVDIVSYGSMQKSSQLQYHLELPPIPETFTAADQNQITLKITDMFHVNNLQQIVCFGMQLIRIGSNCEILIYQLLSRFTQPIREGIIRITKLLIEKLMNDGINFVSAFNQLSPHGDVLYKIFKFVVTFLQQKVDEMEQDYQIKLAEAKTNPDFNEQAFNAEYTINPCTAKRTLDFFANYLHLFFVNVELALRELMNTFNAWLSVQIYEFISACVNKEKRQSRQQQPKTKQTCSVCTGHYYTQ